MSDYSILSLIKNAVHGNEKWERAWRDPVPKKHYDVIIVGAGGHGLASAFYLAKNHGIKNIAVLEKGYLGGGNTGRNTTIVRSNYMLDENALFYEKSLKLWEQLSHELNFNVMFSQRGVLNLAHSDSQMDAVTRRGNTMRLNGIDAELVNRGQIEKMLPYLDFSNNARFQIKGGLLQKRGGTARHDAVAWGFARAADQLGVDIIQNCEVTGFKMKGNAINSVETSKGTIDCDKVGFAVAGSTGHLASKLGMKLPIESHVLQAFVSEPLKPIIDNVVTFGAGHFYISQSDKGGLVFGGDIDMYNSYAQKGNLPLIEDVVTAGLAMIPGLSRLRIVRHWGGVMDMSMDGSPIIGKSPIDNLYLNCGWCYGGFKATPGSGWVFAHTIANDAPHELNVGLNFDRFRKGRSVDENGGGPVPNRH
ncbi:sarcosine oxidase subunit beta family protein [Rhodospirillaceae bacterium]|nr:sarcosine oxidase subunit beta family protein [Rhodospirillaceae bacterium]MBT6306140.1 sarcosine oxidase subunit beta family protein [Rhodospirillaceae bacterium]MDC1442761.1 sarcosine oxidase subunit beta family protein [Rhodospirillaceae bacterium]